MDDKKRRRHRKKVSVRLPVITKPQVKLQPETSVVKAKPEIPPEEPKEEIKVPVSRPRQRRVKRPRVIISISEDKPSSEENRPKNRGETDFGVTSLPEPPAPEQTRTRRKDRSFRKDRDPDRPRRQADKHRRRQTRHLPVFHSESFEESARSSANQAGIYVRSYERPLTYSLSEKLAGIKIGSTEAVRFLRGALPVSYAFFKARNNAVFSDQFDELPEILPVQPMGVGIASMVTKNDLHSEDSSLLFGDDSLSEQSDTDLLLTDDEVAAIVELAEELQFTEGDLERVILNLLSRKFWQNEGLKADQENEDFEDVQGDEVSEAGLNYWVIIDQAAIYLSGSGSGAKIPGLDNGFLVDDTSFVEAAEEGEQEPDLVQLLFV